METVCIDYMINAKCNLNCPFCFGTKKETDVLKKDEKLSLIYQLSKIKNIRLVISGGEPLVDNDILDVCSLVKSLNIKMAVHTNGTFPHILQKILPFVDWIGMPIDGISIDVQKILRSDSDHLKKVQQCLEIIHSYKKRSGSDFPKIKIGTVLNKKNICEVNNICNFIKLYDIDIWKIYKLRKRGKMSNPIIYDTLQIDDNTINEVIPTIFKNYNKNIYFSDTPELDSYLIIEPNSEIKVIKGNETTSIGHLFENSVFKKHTMQMALSMHNNMGGCRAV